MPLLRTREDRPDFHRYGKPERVYDSTRQAAIPGGKSIKPCQKTPQTCIRSELNTSDRPDSIRHRGDNNVQYYGLFIPCSTSAKPRDQQLVHSIAPAPSLVQPVRRWGQVFCVVNDVALWGQDFHCCRFCLMDTPRQEEAILCGLRVRLSRGWGAGQVRRPAEGY